MKKEILNMRKPMAYITAAWGNNEFEVTETAAKYCRKLYEAGYTPICPPLYLPLFLCDQVPQEHKDGIDMARDTALQGGAMQRILSRM